MRIAIVKLSALGDIVHAMVALQFIKQSKPDIMIDWVVEGRFAGVLQDNPDINQVLTVNLKSLKQNKRDFFKEFNRIKRYAENNYDLVIDAQGLIKSAVITRLLSDNTAGFDRLSVREKIASYVYSKKIHCPYDANSIDRNVTVIGKPLGLDMSEKQVLNKAPFLFYQAWNSVLATYFSASKGNIIFVIGSTWPSRNYPKEKYLEVIEALHQNSLLIWGNTQEKADADWIAKRTGRVRVLPALSFNDLKAVLDASDLVIGNDTGPTHMAWGLNKPSITLFGPTPVSRVYQTSINKVLKSPSVVNPLKLNKQDFSIKEIAVEDVAALAALLLHSNDDLKPQPALNTTQSPY